MNPGNIGCRNTGSMIRGLVFGASSPNSDMSSEPDLVDDVSTVYNHIYIRKI